MWTSQAEYISVSKKNIWGFIIVLKVLACFLITNSHCGDLYPIRFLAIGGTFGNAIFFIVSGYCLTNIKTGFGSWYKKRLGRIVPSLLVIILLDIFFVQHIVNVLRMNPVQFFVFYVNHYWFVFGIFLCYTVFYLVMRFPSAEKVCLAVWAGGYALAYVFLVDKTSFSVEPSGFAFFKTYFYFGVMLTGGLIRRKQDVIIEKIKGRRWLLWLTLIVSALAWAGSWGTVNVLHRAYRLQFLVHVSVYVFAAAILLLACMYKFDSCGRNRLLTLIADSTLEIYFVQVTFSKYVYALSIDFPLGLLVFYLMAFGGGVAFHVGEKYLEYKIKKIS